VVARDEKREKIIFATNLNVKKENTKGLSNIYSRR
jgi:hypothetical protein